LDHLDGKKDMNDSHHHDNSTNLICGYLCIDRAPFPFHDRGAAPNSFGPNFNPVFGIARMIPFLISIVWLGIGIWQWFELSKWTKRYERYKELQKSIDEKLSNEDKG
jgi:hypothetical protein